MELEVKRVGLQSCFVALPQSVLEILLSSNRLPSLPVVIELNPAQNFGGSSSYYVGWDGAASSSPHIEVPEALAECIGLPTGARVRVRARGDVSAAETVVVEPATEDDWEILELNAEYLENHILSKVGVVIEGQNFPVWVTGKVVLTLRVISTSPKGIVKLVPGVELVVAPKKRQLNKEVPPASDFKPAERLPEQRNVLPDKGAWFRVQELHYSFMQTMDLAGVTCSTTPTTAIFISPNTAKEIPFEDGQVVILSSGLSQNHEQIMASKVESHDRTTGVDGGKGKHAGAQYSDDDDFSEVDEETHQRHAVVRLKFWEGVGAGHVMVAFPVRLFIGATIHMLVQLQPASLKDFVQPKALVLSPVLFRPAEEVDFSGANRSDEVETIGISKFLEQEKDESQSSDNIRAKWKGHRYILAAAAGFQKERTVQQRVHNKHVSSLLLSWFNAQATVNGNASEGMPIASEVIVHIQMSSFGDEGLEERQASHKFARSSTMPEVFVETGDRNRVRVRNFLFLLRAFSSNKGGSQSGRQQGNAQPPGYLLLYEEFLSLQSRLSEPLDKVVKGGLSTLRQGIPRQLSCITGMNAEIINGPSLKSLPWLEGPALEVLARLHILLSHNSRSRLKLLGTPLPGSVLLHGPMACGKTQLALALARELQDDQHVLAHGVLVECSELVGEQAMTIRGVLQDALQEAVDHAPSLIILDDLDLLLPAGESEGPEPGVAVLSISEFLADLMDISQGRRNNEFPAAAIAFLAVAKAPTTLPSCLCTSGRLDFYVQLPAPAASERAAILAQIVRSHGLVCTESVAAKAAANCEGADASDMELLVDRAVHAAASRFLTSEMEKQPSQAAAITDIVMAQDHQKMLKLRKSLNYQQSLPLMQKKFELVDKDFMAALKEFVPLAFRGVAKPGSQQVHMGWEDVGGLYETRVSLQEMLEMPVKYSKIFAQAPLRLRTGVLLYGPPGCGKTHIVAAAAAACSLRLISVKGPELLNKYIGASEQGVRDVFAKATAAAPCILFFDEFDAIAPQRGHDNTGVTDRVVNQLLTELDGVEALNGVFVFAATSRPDLLDAALLRPGRLDRLLMCDFPSSRERYEILQVLARKLPLADDVDLDLVASVTEGFSGADLQAVLSDAQLESVHSFLNAAKEKLHEKKPKITMSQLGETVNKARPSVPDSERKRLYSIYDAFMGAKTSLSSKRDKKGKRATLA